LVDGETRELDLRGDIDDGEWEVDEELSQEVQGEIARCTGSVHSYTLFTGVLRAAHPRRDAAPPDPGATMKAPAARDRGPLRERAG
jgi:hypothetical protein